MNGKGKLLKGVSLALTIYFVVSLPVYLMEGESLEGHPIFGALYLLAIGFHEGFIFLALLFQWFGVIKTRRWAINLAILLLIVAAIELALLVYPILILLPLILIDIFAKLPKAEIES